MSNRDEVRPTPTNWIQLLLLLFSSFCLFVSFYLPLFLSLCLSLSLSVCLSLSLSFSLSPCLCLYLFLSLSLSLFLSFYLFCILWLYLFRFNFQIIHIYLLVISIGVVCPWSVWISVRTLSESSIRCWNHSTLQITEKTSEKPFPWSIWTVNG